MQRGCGCRNEDAAAQGRRMAAKRGEKDEWRREGSDMDEWQGQGRQAVTRTNGSDKDGRR